MKASDFKPLWRNCKKVIPYGLIYLAGLCILLYAYRHIIIFPLTHDTVGYAKQIETGSISSWWSALFMYECRLILYFLRIAFGEGIPVEWSIYIVYAACLCIMIVSMHVVLKMIESRGGSAFIPACILSGCAGFAYILGVGSFGNITRLDTPGSALLFSAAVFTLKLKRDIGIKRLCAWISVVLLLMVHACSYRTPFLMVAFIMSLYMGYVLESRRTWLRVLMRSSAICLLFYGAVIIVNHALPEYEHRDDTMRPMFESDIKLSGILECDGFIIDRLVEENLLELSAKEEGVKRFHLVAAHYGMVKGASAWPVLRKAYVKRWKEKPVLMVEARLIQMFHFLTGDYTPEWFQQIVALGHPHMHSSGLVLGRYEWPTVSRSSAIRFLLALLVCVGGIVVPLLLHLCKSGSKGNPTPVLLYLSLLCISSLACYLVIVVPTSDFRYRIQALLLSGLALSMSWNIIVSNMRSAISKENVSQLNNVEKD